jgi:hypothetical protein
MDLVLLVCLAGLPQNCREERVAVAAAPAHATGCMFSALPVIIEWTEDHPQWNVARWTCGAPRR